MSINVLPQGSLPPASAPRLPHLPLELIWTIIEQNLIQLSSDTRGRDSSVIIPVHLITLNRVIHALVVKLVYQTVILSSSRALAKFLSLLTNSPNIANLVQNLWIGTPRLEVFAHQFGWAPYTVKRILERTENLRGLALPAAFFPLGPNKLSLNRLTVNGSGFAELLGKPSTLHIYGLAQPEILLRSAGDSLRRVVCELRRPCAPGAVERFVRGLLEYKEVGLKLDLVVLPGLGTWLDGELTGIQDICYGMTVQIRQSSSTESSAEEWARGCKI